MTANEVILNVGKILITPKYDDKTKLFRIGEIVFEFIKKNLFAEWAQLNRGEE